MSRSLFEARLTAEDANGNRLAGAKLYAYEAGTTTAVDLYANSGMTTIHPKPLVADAGGVFPQVYVANGSYDYEIRTSAGALVVREENVAQYTADVAIKTLADFGVVEGGAYDNATELAAAEASVKADTDEIKIAPGTYLASGTTYTLGHEAWWYDAGFTRGINLMKAARGAKFTVTGATATDAAYDAAKSLNLFNMTNDVQGGQHGNGIRVNLNNSSSFSLANTCTYAHAVSSSTSASTIGHHAETRHNGGQSTCFNAEIETFTAAGAAYGIVLKNSTRTSVPPHEMDGTLPTEHPTVTAAYIQGENNQDPMGGFRFGVRFAANSMRTANGVSISCESAAASHFQVTQPAGTADIYLNADSTNGIVLQGNYSGAAIRLDADQQISLTSNNTVGLKYNSAATDIEVFGGGNNLIEMDTSGGSNPVSIRVNGAMKQVHVGAADSGGTGWRVLRVAN